MIGRPPPPAAPKSGPPCYRLCHSKVAGQDTACRVVERASSTLRRPKTQDKCQSLRTEGALRSVRDFARKEWPLRGSTTSRSAIADRRHLSGGTSASGHALWSQTGRGSATATVLIRSPYSCWLQRREWAPYSPQGTRHLRRYPAPPPVCIRRCPAIPTSTIFCRSETSKLLVPLPPACKSPSLPRGKQLDTDGPDDSNRPGQ